MGDPMPIRDEDVGRIGEYVKPWLRELVNQMVPTAEIAGLGPQLMERMVRVEEELKAQRDLMDERFVSMDRRFTDLLAQMNARFEGVDRRFESADQRFEDLIAQMNKRFESVDKRFNTLTWMIGVGFAVITSLTTIFALLA